ncbi:hypothetical protein WA158_005172 [Blastocystis sp. Blastoise]
MSDDFFNTEDPFATEEVEEEEEVEEVEEEEEEEEVEEEEDPFADARDTEDTPISMSSGLGDSQPTEDEFKLIREWTMKFREQNEEKDRVSAEKKAATIQKAKEDIEAFYQARQLKHDSKLAADKELEETFVESTKADYDLPNPWERVTKMVDFNTDAKKNERDITRMKQVVIRMKADTEKSL